VEEHRRGGTEVIDGLRGFAILWVLCYHTWLFSWYTPALRLFGRDVPVDLLPRVGYLGVDLFFVISGFCLFVPGARRALYGNPEPPLRSFFARRLLKIVPSYALAVCATIPVALPYLRTQHAVWQALAVHFAFVNSFYVDTLGQANSVFWSLAIEVQFYVLFPALAWCFRRAPLPTAGAMIAVALAYRLHFAGCCLQNEIVMRELPAFLDVFACGMLAAYGVVWAQRNLGRLREHAMLMTIAALAFIVALYFLLQTCNAVQYVPRGRETWDLYGRTLFGALVAAIAFCASFAVRPLRATIANPVLVFLSLISYNLYLWHTLLMIYMWKHGIPRSASHDPHSDDHWKFLFITLGWSASLAVATAVTYFIERPLLGAIKPHPFAFDWQRVVTRLRPGRQRPIARPETRT
jgi:peptidoglycan/LPS O-acetylase OafA/YrhL